jgi:plasmid stabilization system protein ParE
MSPYVLTPAAEDDVREILDYVERDNPSVLDKVHDGLRDAMRLLAEHPGIGHTRTDLASEAVRFWPVFKFLVIYRPDTKPLEVVRVLRGKRDVRQLLDE